MTTAGTLATTEETTARAKLADLQLAHGLAAPEHMWWQDASATANCSRILCLHVHTATRAEAERWAKALKIKPKRKSYFFDTEGGWCASRTVTVRVPDWMPGVTLRLNGQETAWWDRPGGER